MIYTVQCEHWGTMYCYVNNFPLSDEDIRLIKKWSAACEIMSDDEGCGDCEWAGDDCRPDDDKACVKLWDRLDRLERAVKK